jgi:hypothetical protein
MIWTSSDGKQLRVSQMQTMHLLHALNKLAREPSWRPGANLFLALELELRKLEKEHDMRAVNEETQADIGREAYRLLVKVRPEERRDFMKQHLTEVRRVVLLWRALEEACDAMAELDHMAKAD